MASPCRRKINLSVDDLGYWKEDCENKKDEEEEGEVFYWSKPIQIEEERDYVRVPGKQQ